MHGPCLRVCSYLSSPPPLQPAPLQARRVPGECACEVGAGSAAGLNPRSATCTTVHLPLLPPMEHAGLRGEHAGPQHLQGAYTQKPHRVPSMRARTHTHACMQGDSRHAESWLLRAPALPHTHAPTHTHRLTRASSAPSAAALWRATTCWTGERSAAQRSAAGPWSRCPACLRLAGMLPSVFGGAAAGVHLTSRSLPAILQPPLGLVST